MLIFKLSSSSNLASVINSDLYITYQNSVKRKNLMVWSENFISAKIVMEITVLQKYVSHP